MFRDSFSRRFRPGDTIKGVLAKTLGGHSVGYKSFVGAGIEGVPDVEPQKLYQKILKVNCLKAS